MVSLVELRNSATEAHRAGELEKAERGYSRYLSQSPNDAGIWSNLGSLHRKKGRYRLAIFAQRQAVALAPNEIGLKNNLANVLSDVGEYDESIAIRREILKQEPRSLNHLAMIGRCLRGKGDYAAAISHLEDAIDDHPDDAELQLQLAFALLGQGDYATGFAAYEARWNAGELKPRNLAYPQWQGEDLAGKSITVMPEQGFGDAVFFLRFVAYLKSMGPHVRLAAEGPMLRLFERLPGVDEVVTVAEAAEPTDFWVNMMDLSAPALLEGNIVPPVELAIPEDSKTRAAQIVAPFKGRTKVGVVWTGSATYKGNTFRSFSHTDLFPLADIPSVQLFSLYKGPFLKDFYEDGADTIMVDAGSLDRDFADCAANMCEMDLIITSDTATAHIAGSLGLPTWVVLHWDPFWVWTHTGEETPWYPSIRLFRQTEPLVWDEVIGQVKQSLASFKKG